MIDSVKRGTEVDLNYSSLLPSLQIPFGIGVILATLQQTGKLPKRRSPRNTIARRGPENQLSSSRKRGNMPNGQCHHINADLTGAASRPMT